MLAAARRTRTACGEQGPGISSLAEAGLVGSGDAPAMVVSVGRLLLAALPTEGDEASALDGEAEEDRRGCCLAAAVQGEPGWYRLCKARATSSRLMTERKSGCLSISEEGDRHASGQPATGMMRGLAICRGDDGGPEREESTPLTFFVVCTVR